MCSRFLPLARILLPLCAVSLAASRGVAAAPAVDGAALVQDSFNGGLPKTWRAVKGDWQPAGDAVAGTEVAAQKHPAVIRRPLAFTNAVISFSFRLDRARQISLSVNDAKEHVCRLIITARGFVVQKDDHDHDGPDKARVFARVPMKLAPDAWHTATVEIRGAEMIAHIDDPSHVGSGSDSLLDRPKANLGLTVAGGPAEFKSVTVSPLPAASGMSGVTAGE